MRTPATVKPFSQSRRNCLWLVTVPLSWCNTEAQQDSEMQKADFSLVVIFHFHLKTVNLPHKARAVWQILLYKQIWIPPNAVALINSERLGGYYIFSSLFSLFSQHQMITAQFNNRYFSLTRRLSIMRQFQKWVWYWLHVRLPGLVWVWQLLVTIFQRMEAAVTLSDLKSTASISPCETNDRSGLELMTLRAWRTDGIWVWMVSSLSNIPKRVLKDGHRTEDDISTSNCVGIQSLEQGAPELKDCSSSKTEAKAATKTYRTRSLRTVELGGKHLWCLLLFNIFTIGSTLQKK